MVEGGRGSVYASHSPLRVGLGPRNWNLSGGGSTGLGRAENFM